MIYLIFLIIALLIVIGLLIWAKQYQKESIEYDDIPSMEDPIDFNAPPIRWLKVDYFQPAKMPDKFHPLAQANIFVIEPNLPTQKQLSDLLAEQYNLYFCLNHEEYFRHPKKNTAQLILAVDTWAFMVEKKVKKSIPIIILSPNAYTYTGTIPALIVKPIQKTMTLNIIQKYLKI